MKKHHSKLLLLPALLIVAATVPLQRAQTVSVVRVLSNPEGPAFSVDGTVYYHPMSAFWPVGSQHTLGIPSGEGYTYNIDQTIQWKFQGWQWSGDPLLGNAVQVIASPSVTEYQATYSSSYKFTVQLSCNPSCTSEPGVILVNGSKVSGDVSSWQDPGTSIVLQAFPNPGWTFAGWQQGPNQSITSLQNTVTLASPMTITAVFLPTKTVNFVTIPPGLQVYADRTPISTPASLQWGQGSSHTVGAMDVQQGTDGKRWIFQSWSDNGAPTHTYVTGNNLYDETITANHVPAVYPFFLTSPPNLNLVVDNLTLPPPYSYIWGAGQTHRIVAPTTQTDAQGNTWTFKSWDDQVTTPARDITVPPGAEVDNIRLTALYTAQSRLTVASTLSGLVVTVDGTPCITPCSIVRDPGTQVHVSAPVSVPAGDGSRQDLRGWSTNGADPVPGDWVATLNRPNISISATYHSMNRLSVAANPSDAAAWTIAPASTDGFYDSQTLVSLGVNARPGYRFNSWSGDLSGSTPAGALTMSAPRQVIAEFSHVPYIAPTGVSNAAGATPQPGVASGSVASIFGASLAVDTAVGPANQLVQTLAGVVVHIGTRLLPLYFVSPGQINVQIPPDLPLGTQTITISSQAMPDVHTDVNIVRAAPGLFPVMLDGQFYALVLHEDGALVTNTSPARKGELLTAYGTGFGPTDHARPEGLALPLSPPYLILEPVTMQVGDSVVIPQSAFAAPGQIGLDVVQFRLDSSAPSGAAARLYLTIDGVNSNTLNLPIE
jgi:uncharacterized protein (TIGR03437 family)